MKDNSKLKAFAAKVKEETARKPVKQSKKYQVRLDGDNYKVIIILGDDFADNSGYFIYPLFPELVDNNPFPCTEQDFNDWAKTL